MFPIPVFCRGPFMLLFCVVQSQPLETAQMSHQPTHPLPLETGACDVRIYFQLEQSLLEIPRQLLNLLSEVPLTSRSYNTVPFPSLLQTIEANQEQNTPAGRFVKYCKIFFVCHTVPLEALGKAMDLSALRNPRFLNPTSDMFTLETENTYILPIRMNENVSNFTQIATLKTKTFASRMQSLVHQYFKVGLHDLNPHYFNIDGKIHGTGFEFTVALAQVYNFTYSFSMVMHQLITLEDGTLGGWENEVASGRIDVDAFFVANYVAHRRTLEYTTPVWKLSIIYLAKVPSHDTKWTTILDVMEPRTWLALSAITMAFSIVAYAKLRVARRRETKHIGTTIFFLVYNSVIAQSVGHIPGSLRGLALVWLFSCLVMTNFFCSNLLSLLTSPVADEEIPKNMWELAQRKEYTILGMDHPGGPMEEYFNKTTTEHLQSIWKRTILLPVDKCILESITTKRTVCLGWDFIFEGILQANATLNELFDPAVSTDAGIIPAMHNIIVRKNMLYADAFNEAVGWFRDTGVYLGWLKQSCAITKHYGREWLTSKGMRKSKLFTVLDKSFQDTIKAQGEPLRVSFLTAPLIVLTVGTVIAFIIIVAEQICSKGRKKLDRLADGTAIVNKEDITLNGQTMFGGTMRPTAQKFLYNLHSSVAP